MRAKYLVRSINDPEFLWLEVVTPTSWEHDLLAGRVMESGAPVTRLWDGEESAFRIFGIDNMRSSYCTKILPKVMELRSRLGPLSGCSGGPMALAWNSNSALVIKRFEEGFFHGDEFWSKLTLRLAYHCLLGNLRGAVRPVK